VFGIYLVFGAWDLVFIPRVSASAEQSRAPSPLLLLVRTNALQSWRRVKSIRHQSRLLTLVIGLFMVGYCALSFWLFLKGLDFVATRFPAFGILLLERLLYLLFAFLFVLLMLSNLVISYSNFFRNREALALMTWPVSAETLFRWKLIESGFVASWAFLFLIAPFLAAYGMTRHVSWHFYPFTILLVGLFIMLPCVLGGFLATVVARYMDRRSFQIGAVFALLICIGLIAFSLRPDTALEGNTDTRVAQLLDKTLTRTALAQFPLLPSYWLSTSVLQWMEGAFSAAAFFAAVLLSNVLFFGSLAFNFTGKFFYSAASSVQSRSSVFRRWHWFQLWQRQQQLADGLPGRLERLIALVPRMPPDIGALIVKDARMFWRDTAQWGQSLMLFGLLGVYIINLRHFSQQLTNAFWINLVAFLNLGACSLNLATITTRFVYPQFSLEGKRLWIVGMAPLGLMRVVKTKYVTASAASLVMTFGLIWLSCYMLDMDANRTLFFTAAVVVMTFTLNGLAVGLGVLYPNLKEENPSKIVSGFGGTFCLVLSFLYILASVILLALGAPWTQSPNAEGIIRSVMCLSGFGVLSFALGWIPLQVGFQRVKSFEV
jgi:ABC-2 type transport system permease protein